MIEYVFGAKGSGKTKKMIDMANESLTKAKGSVLFLNDRDKYRATVSTQIRFINTDEFFIEGENEMYGFVCGTIASNYDVEYVYIDNLLRILDVDGVNDDGLRVFVEKLKKLDTDNINFVLSISCSEDQAPDFLK